VVTPVEDLVNPGIYLTVIILILVLIRIVSVERRRIGRKSALRPMLATMRCSHRRKKDHKPTSQVALCLLLMNLKIVADGNMFTYEETEQMIETGMHEWYEGMPDLWTNLVEHEEMVCLWLFEHARNRGRRAKKRLLRELPRHTLRRTTMYTWTFR
jgi:hypothetical protein